MTVILLAVLVPFSLAVLAALWRRQASILPLAGGAALALAVLAGLTSASVQLTRAFAGPFVLAFAVDAWRLLLLGFAAAFALAAGVHALGALRRAARPALLAASLLAAFGATAGVVLAANVLLLLIFWEIFLLALYGAIHSGGDAAERTATKALVIGGASDFLLILGLMAYLQLGGGAAFDAPLATTSSPTAFVAFVLVFLGAGAKAGMFPFHTWIPEAAERMPATGFAALPASLEKLLGISFLVTVTTKMFVLDPRARTVMLVLGLLTVFAMVLPAMVERSLKRVLALTAIAPVGFMVVALAVGGEAGIAGALLTMLAHALYKSAMFFAAGSLEAANGSDRLEALEGAARRNPVLAGAFVLAAAAAVSLPPTGGFLGKELIFEALAHHQAWLVLGLLVLGAGLLAAVMIKVVVTLLAPRSAGAERVPVIEVAPVAALGVAAALSAAAFTAMAPAFSSPLGAADTTWVTAPWHLSIVTVASLAVWGFAALVYLAGRDGRAATAFTSLRHMPLVGTGLAAAERGLFDAYELGLKAVEVISKLVFGIERLIDVATDALIAFGRAIFRPTLSAAHNGLYGNYLAWTVAGLAVVLVLVLA